MGNKTETKNCQSCQQDFTIEPEDFNFYEKIKVPPPTWCPECRMIRRMMWRNERVWYHRTCDATGKNILSIFDPEKGYKVYDHEYWKSDAWDPLDYGREYSFSRNFFEQFSELMKEIPHTNLIQKNNVNSEYSNNSLNLKNCYMVIAADAAENSAYLCGLIRRIKESLDLYQCNDDEYCYDCVDCDKSNKLFFSRNCTNCIDSYFLYDCRNCLNCIGCVGLRNKNYYIFNESYSRDEYFKKLKEFNTGSFKSLEKIKQKFEALKLSIPRKYAYILNSQNVTGDDIINAKDCFHSFNVKYEVENCRYSYRITQNVKDIVDTLIGWNGSELLYDVLSGNGKNIKFSGFIWGGFDIEYSYNCFDCNNIFGCVGLRNKSYCILNKQYSKEEYFKLVDKVKSHMNEKKFSGSNGRVYGYGEFFPMELSPFDYNESLVQEYFTKNKNEVIQMKLTWKDSDEKNYEITKKNSELEDDISNFSDSILEEVIECGHKGKCSDQCFTAFRIIPKELTFLRRFNLPLPRLCFNCRHMERVRLKNPMKLWHRKCMKEGCHNEFETAYAPDRPEKVYCERCYQREVY